MVTPAKITIEIPTQTAVNLSDELMRRCSVISQPDFNELNNILFDALKEQLYKITNPELYKLFKETDAAEAGDTAAEESDAPEIVKLILYNKAVAALAGLCAYCKDQLNSEYVSEALELIRDSFEMKYEFESRTYDEEDSDGS